jgi:hypothetical protein
MGWSPWESRNLECTYQRTQETYSPVGRRKRRMYWSGCQSTGAEMRKYLTGMASAENRNNTGQRVFGARLRWGGKRARTVVDLLEGDDAVRR